MRSGQLGRGSGRDRARLQRLGRSGDRRRRSGHAPPRRARAPRSRSWARRSTSPTASTRSASRVGHGSPRPGSSASSRRRRPVFGRLSPLRRPGVRRPVRRAAGGGGSRRASAAPTRGSTRVATSSTLDRVFGSFVAVFGVFVLVVAAVIIAGSTAMRIVTQRRTSPSWERSGPHRARSWRPCSWRTSSSGRRRPRSAGSSPGSSSRRSRSVSVARSGRRTRAGRCSVCVVSSWSSSSARRRDGRAGTVRRRRPVTDVLRDVPPGRRQLAQSRAAPAAGRLSLLGAQEAASQPARGGLAALAIGVAVIGTVVSFGFISSARPRHHRRRASR